MGKGTSLDEPVTEKHVPDLGAARYEIDEYLHANRVYDTFDYLLKELLTKQPADPLQHMLDCLQTEFPTGPLKIFVSGPPGLGKRTLAQRLAELFGIEYIGTGDLLRQAGIQTEGVVLADEEQTADLVIDKLKEVSNRNAGFVLEGFPRTRKEASYLKEEAIVPAHVLLLKASADFIHNRNRQIAAGESEGTAMTQELLDSKLHIFSGRTSTSLEAYVSRITCIPAEGSHDEILAEMARIARKLPLSRAPLPPPRVVLIGPRGAGATEQAVQLALRTGAVLVDVSDLQMAPSDVPTVSTAAGESSPKQHKTTLKKGVLRRQRTRMDLPNQEVLKKADPLGIVGVRLRQPDCVSQGFVLTGFPNTLEEAEALEQDSRLRPARVMCLQASQDTCVDRLSMVATDPITSKVWRTVPDSEATRRRLVRDPRNSEEAVRTAHEEFESALPSIVEVFQSDGRCMTVSAEGAMQQVFRELADFVDRPLPLPLPMP